MFDCEYYLDGKVLWGNAWVSKNNEKIFFWSECYIDIIWWLWWLNYVYHGKLDK